MIGSMLDRLEGEARTAAKGAKLLYGMLRERPFLCNWQITYRCNLKCGICSFWRDPPSAREELDLDGVRAVAERLRPFAPLMLSMAGGEPLLRRDLPEIARLLARDHWFSLITNGWFLTRELAERLYDAGLQDIHVSLDYADPDRHDAQRGVRGSFARAVTALELLRDLRPDRRHRVHIMAVLLDDNVDEVEPLIRLAEDLGVSFELSLYSHRRGQKPVRVPGRPVAARLAELKRGHPAFVSYRDYLAEFDRAVAADGMPACRAGRTFFNIDHRGRVSRCIDTNDQPSGSLLDQPLDVLLGRLRDQARFDPCSRCWTSCRGFADVAAGPLRFLRTLPDLYQGAKAF
ncbi:MAG: radical SAM protein [Deltaproteobacteria bacterium]|nr:radical SAM protein [Deltaproteobacteria bacterium]